MDLAYIRKKNKEMVDVIMNEPKPHKRAKMATDLWLKLNPWVKLPNGKYTTARLENMNVLEDVKEKRKMWEMANRGKNIKGDRGKWGQQMAYELPSDLLTIINLFCPDMLSGKGDEQKQNFRKTMRLLKQYQIPTRDI